MGGGRCCKEANVVVRIDFARDVASPAVRVLEVTLIRGDKPPIENLALRVSAGFLQWHALPHSRIKLMELID